MTSRFDRHSKGFGYQPMCTSKHTLTYNNSSTKAKLNPWNKERVYAGLVPATAFYEKGIIHVLDDHLIIMIPELNDELVVEILRKSIYTLQKAALQM